MASIIYNLLHWANGRNGQTPLSADNLNHMDEGIQAATNQANDALQAAADQASSTLTSANTYTDSASATALASAQSYTDDSTTQTALSAKLNGLYGALAGANTWAGTQTLPVADKGGQVFNVKTYGAKGDGATDDTTAIKAAYTAAKVVSGTVLFPPATYIISSTLNPTGTTTSGYGATVKSVGAVTGFTMFQASGGFTMLGLTVDGNKVNTTQPGGTQGQGVYCFNAASFSGVLVRDVTVQNVWACGIRLQTSTAVTDAGTQTPSTPATIDRCVVLNTGLQGIYLTVVGDVEVARCHVTAAGADGIYDYATLRSGINNNRVVGAGNHAIVTQFSADAAITGNRVKGSTKAGITVGGGTIGLTPASGYAITGNTSVGNTTHGIDIDTTLTDLSTSNAPGAVTGNTCRGNTLHGIYVNGSREVAISGNICKGNGSCGIALSGQNLSISGNALTGNGNGLAFEGTMTGLGSYRVAGNYVAGNTTTDYSYGTDIAHSAADTVLGLIGSGAPAMDAPLGSTYHNTAGGAGTTLYVKTATGTGGWAAAA